MKSSAQVVVIGGGVVGCSVLFHLAKAGWTDVLLIERSELTSGSSWHAAGGFHTLNGDPNVAKLQAYTVSLYEELEKLSGQACSLHLTGGVMMADTKERMDFLRYVHATGRALGMETEIITPSEARSMFPLMDESHFVGALWDPVEGHLDPSGTTHAYAKAAQKLGAEIVLRNRVVELLPVDGEWDVVTEQGTVRAQHVVNAGGLWAREIGRMVGLELPVLAMEHMYMITDDIPEVVEFNQSTGQELVGVIDFKAEIYTRQEGNGLALGTYEKNCKPWSPQNTPWDFGHELLQPDFDRIGPSLELGAKHFPGFAEAGVKQTINGPFTFAPDGNPLIGPVQGLQNFWCACAVMAGFSQGGGVGLALANWITEGDPGHDPAGRPQQTTPLYDLMVDKNNAVMGDTWGLETPLWFAPVGTDAKDILSFHRSNDFEHIANEVKAVRESVGVTEIANFAKYRITGSNSEQWLNGLMTNTMPRTGRVVLTPMLNHFGKLIGDFTIAKVADNHFMMWGSSGAQIYHQRWFEQQQPNDQTVHIDRLGQTMVGLSIAGPKARDVLQPLVDIAVDNDHFKFMDFKQTDVAGCPCMINRLSYTGDLGYELWMEPAYQRRIYLAIKEAGARFNIKDFGMRALLSMRLEKNFPTWFAELRPIYGPYEADMDRFVKLTKNQFIGREKAQQEFEQGPKLKRVSLSIQTDNTDVMGDEPIWAKCSDRQFDSVESPHGYGAKRFDSEGTVYPVPAAQTDGQWCVVGWVTSGGYGHSVKLSLAQGYLPAELASPDSSIALEVEILGVRCPAKIMHEPPFDPTGERMRG